jgi:hypothetical protein
MSRHGLHLSTISFDLWYDAIRYSWSKHRYWFEIIQSWGESQVGVAGSRVRCLWILVEYFANVHVSCVPK